MCNRAIPTDRVPFPMIQSPPPAAPLPPKTHRGGLGEIISPSVPLTPQAHTLPSKSPAKSQKSMTPPLLPNGTPVRVRYIHRANQPTNPATSRFSYRGRTWESGTPHQPSSEIQVKTASQQKSQSARVVPSPLSRRGLPPQGIELQPACCPLIRDRTRKMKVQNSCVPTSGRRADNDLNLRHQTKPNSPPDTDSPIPPTANSPPKDDLS